MTTTMTRERYVTPRVNVREDSDAVTIEAEFPGVAQDDAEVEVRDGNLILKGNRKTNGEDGNYRVHERHNAGFYRSFALGEAIDSEKVDAKMSDGVLTVTLQKADRLKPRTININ